MRALGVWAEKHAHTHTRLWTFLGPSWPISELWVWIRSASWCKVNPYLLCKRHRIEGKRANLSGLRNFTDVHICSPASKQWAHNVFLPIRKKPQRRTAPNPWVEQQSTQANCPASSWPLGKDHVYGPEGLSYNWSHSVTEKMQKSKPTRYWAALRELEKSSFLYQRFQRS